MNTTANATKTIADNAAAAMQAVLDAAGEGSFGGMGRVKATGRTIYGPNNTFASITIAVCGCDPARPSLNTPAETAALKAGAAVVQAAGVTVRQGR